MMCSVIQEIDDPYGFGLSLDERVLGDGAKPLRRMGVKLRRDSSLW